MLYFLFNSLVWCFMVLDSIKDSIRLTSKFKLNAMITSTLCSRFTRSIIIHHVTSCKELNSSSTSIFISGSIAINRLYVLLIVFVKCLFRLRISTIISEMYIFIVEQQSLNIDHSKLSLNELRIAIGPVLIYFGIYLEHVNSLCSSLISGFSTRLCSKPGLMTTFTWIDPNWLLKSRNETESIQF